MILVSIVIYNPLKDGGGGENLQTISRLPYGKMPTSLAIVTLTKHRLFIVNDLEIFCLLQCKYNELLTE